MPQFGSMWRGFFLAVAFGLIVSGLAYTGLSMRDVGPKTYIIERSESGFSPQELWLKPGDSAVFKNRRVNEAMWPASDFHPRHSQYHEFDPQNEIAPGEEWSFVFKKPGSWSFHDHLEPKARGVINVLDINGSDAKRCTTDIAALPYQEKFRCWSEAVTEVLKQDGLGAAFEAFSKIYAENPSFGADCHDVMHVLGDAAYRKFERNELVTGNRATTYCGYGFYHGFTEAMIQEEGNLKNGVRFCESLSGEKGLKQELSGSMAKDACLHGLGHGIFDNLPPRLWGDAEKMTGRALEECDSIMEDKGQPLRQCTTGVFNALANSYGDGKHIYELYQPEDDPLKICRDRKEKYGSLCYNEVSLIHIRQKDMEREEALRFLESIPITIAAEEAAYGYLSDEVRIAMGKTSVEEWGKICASITPRFREACVRGVVIAFYIWGPPKTEHVPLTRFCELRTISDYRELCAKEFLSRLAAIYDREERTAICKNIPADLQKYCVVK